MKKVLRGLRSILFDERGAVTTVEIIGYSVLIGGAVALIGFGLTALSRGKLGDITGDIKDIKAMDDLVDENSGYGYVEGSEEVGNSGIVTGVDGQ